MMPETNELLELEEMFSEEVYDDILEYYDYLCKPF
jgi:hypothetical protein